MKSVVLVPYCPLPADTGGKVEMWKHLNVLKELGPCAILSAGSKPVGCGWTPEHRREIEARGFKVVLREDECPRLSWRQWMGIAYAAVCKGFRMEKAFGHSNPYHRFAFDPDWFYRHTLDADIAVINYSYWAWLPCECPKVVMLLDLWSDCMWEGPESEREDLAAADLVVVISKEEETKLNDRGIAKTLWSPPVVQEMSLHDSQEAGLVGSGNHANREGLRWLTGVKADFPVYIYGGLAKVAPRSGFISVDRYDSNDTPYRQCGIILMTTAQGMGVQIKGIEALAAGRAIIARRGAMRGLPPGDGAWVEVATPEEMIGAVRRLKHDTVARLAQMNAAREYYRAHLDAGPLLAELKEKLLATCRTGGRI